MQASNQLSRYHQERLNEIRREKLLEYNLNLLLGLPASQKKGIDLTRFQASVSQRQSRIVVGTDPDFSPDEPIVVKLVQALRHRGFDVLAAELVRYLNKRKNKGLRKKDFGPRPEHTLEESMGAVSALFENLPPYIPNQPNELFFGTLNCLFWDVEKTKKFGPVLQYILKHFGFLAVQETDALAMQMVASAVGYQSETARSNAMAQACGIMFDTARFELVDIIEHEEVVNVDGIDQLRVTLELILFDRFLNLFFRVSSSHLLSMRGGPVSTGVVRYHQCLNLVDTFERSNGHERLASVALGDWNCPVNELKIGHEYDAEPFLNHGWQLLHPQDARMTHRKGGRIDGGFKKYFPEDIVFDSYDVIPTFENLPWIFDHACLRYRMKRLNT